MWGKGVKKTKAVVLSYNEVKNNLSSILPNATVTFPNLSIYMSPFLHFYTSFSRQVRNWAKCDSSGGNDGVSAPTSLSPVLHGTQPIKALVTNLMSQSLPVQCLLGDFVWAIGHAQVKKQDVDTKG